MGTHLPQENSPPKTLPRQAPDQRPSSPSQEPSEAPKLLAASEQGSAAKKHLFRDLLENYIPGKCKVFSI